MDVLAVLLELQLLISIGVGLILGFIRRVLKAGLCEATEAFAHYVCSQNGLAAWVGVSSHVTPFLQSFQSADCPPS